MVERSARWQSRKLKEDIPIKAGDERCPCGTLFRRVARCNESTDGLNLHYDICTHCGFQTYAHNKYSIKVERYHKWRLKGVFLD